MNFTGLVNASGIPFSVSGAPFNVDGSMPSFAKILCCI